MTRIVGLAIVLVLDLSCSGSSRTAEQVAFDLIATPSGPGSIRLTWDGPPSAFILERREPETEFQPVATLASGVDRFVDSGLQPAAIYLYRLRSADGVATTAGTGEVSVRTAEDGFAVFSRPNGSGGDDLYFASGDGTVPPTLIRASGNMTLLWTSLGVVGARSHVVFALVPPAASGELELWTCPLDCGAGALATRIATIPDLDSVGIVADRYVVAIRWSPGGQQLIAFDVEEESLAVLLESTGGLIRAYPRSPFDGAQEIVATVSSTGTDDSVAYVVDVSGARANEVLFREPGGRLEVLQDAVGESSIRERTCALVWCSDGLCLSRRHFFVRADGGTRHELLSLNSQHARICGEFLTWTDAASPSADLYSISIRGGAPRRLTEMPAGRRVRWGQIATDEFAVFERENANSAVEGVFSVRLDGTAQPVNMANATVPMVPREFGLVSAYGGFAFYTREAFPGPLLAAELGVAASERLLPIPGFVRVEGLSYDSGALSGASPELSIIVRSMVVAGGDIHIDLWSVTPDDLGGLRSVRMSRYGRPGWGGLVTEPHSGRIVYQRNRDLFRCQVGLPISERQLTQRLPGIQMERTFWDTAEPADHVFFTLSSQVWSVPADGSSPEVQLTDLPRDTRSVRFHSQDSAGRVWFSASGTPAISLFTAVPGEAGSAVAVSSGLAIADRFWFTF